MSDLLDVLRDARREVATTAHNYRCNGLMPYANRLQAIVDRIDDQIAAQERTERMIAPPRVPTGEQR